MPSLLTAVNRASEKAVSASVARGEAIRLAAAAGFTIREIAAAAGLSASRVHQIIHGR